MKPLPLFNYESLPFILLRDKKNVYTFNLKTYEKVILVNNFYLNSSKEETLVIKQNKKQIDVTLLVGTGYSPEI